MNRGSLFFLGGFLILLMPLYAATAALPLVVTCKPTTGENYIALGFKSDPASQQEACDRYKNTPGFGPAKPIEFKSFTNQNEWTQYIVAHRFAGIGGKAVICQTRAGKVTYAAHRLLNSVMQNQKN